MASNTTPAPDALIPYREARRLYPAVGSLMSVYRRVTGGEFPPAADTLNGQRLWRLADLIAWNNGRRSGWKPEKDAGAAFRKERTAAARAARGRLANQVAA